MKVVDEETRKGVEAAGRYVDVVYASALRQMHGDEGEAGDVTQAVFLLVLRKARNGRLPEEGRMVGWLLNVTRYAVKEARRAARRRRIHEASAAGRRGEEAAVETEASEVRAVLDEALLKLRPVDREVIVRRYLSGEAVQEVASAMGTHENTTSQRIGRALEKLRKILGRQGLRPSAGGLAGILVAEAAMKAPAAVAAGVASGAAGASAAAAGIAKGAAAMMKVITFLRVGLLAAAAFLLLAAISATWMMAQAAPPPAPASAALPTPATLPAATQPVVWVALLVKSPLRSIADYHTTLATDPAPAPPLYKRVPIPDCELEIRRAKDQGRLVRIPRRDYLREVKNGERFRDWNSLDQADRRRIGSLPDGDYLIALCIGESRISNVAAFQINAAFDPTKEPTLCAIPIEPGSGREPRYLGLRGVAPGPNAPAGFDAAFYFPDLVIDGSRIVRPGPQLFIGPGPIPPRQQCESIIDLRFYAPNLALDKPHTIIAGSGKYQSDKVQLAVKQDLDRAWDEATLKIKPPPEPAVMLAGQVIGPDGKPAGGYEVTLGNDTNEPPETETDKEGRFSFVNVPLGKYQLSCNPLQMGSPQLTINDISIPAKDPQPHDLIMTSQCTLTGNVNTPDGKPVAKIDVDLIVQTAQGAEFHTTAQTDEQGRYELASPLGVVDYLGIKGQRVRGKMPVLKSGENQADYILRDSTARPVSRGGR